MLDGNVVDTVCEDAPPAELEVAQIHVCYREGWPSELRRAACRAGADTLLPTMSMTDACVEEDLDQLTGTSLGVFEAYRLRGAMLPHAK
ncbi:hypothetical protein AKJ09_00674 [Labilithrix luteola]|uniref:Uncharacterized protein n=1 Tax=Labilithrix luteola TaxID=1391654 RepID=A0A0K1PKF3_9BACT|nr:hypothetical protein AKJ09_00674 [Labilithrix luteola]